MKWERKVSDFLIIFLHLKAHCLQISFLNPFPLIWNFIENFPSFVEEQFFLHYLWT
jgi:hypothetical protein